METEQINATIVKSLGRQYHKPTPEEIKSGSYYQYEPNYTEDLNAIMPLLPTDAWIWREKGGSWCVESHDESIGVIENEVLALAASEFYLRVNGLWKE